MATGDVIIRIRSDQTSFDTSKAQAELNRLSSVATATGRQLQGAATGYAQVASEMKKLAAGVIGLDKLAEAGGYILDSAKTFESLQAQLKTMTGSTEAAQSAFAQIQKFAQTTPFSLEQATEGFIKLKALGLTPSMDALRSYGNTASAMGKDLMQMIEAVADASTGEFERLKEFGITASQNGDKVKFTFQGITTQVGKNAKEIEQYLQKLGNATFGTAMADQMNTAKGAESNFQDAMQQAAAAIAEKTGAFDAYKSALGSLSGLLTSVSANASAVSGELVAAGSAVAVMLGAKGVAALAAYSGKQIEATVSARALAASQAQAAIASAESAATLTAATVRQTQAKVVDIAATERQLLGLREAIQQDLIAARGTDDYAASLARLNGIQGTLAKTQAASAAARAEYIAATKAADIASRGLTAVQAEQAAASGILATASRGLGTALSLVGGPVGALVLALGGLAYWLTKVRQEEENAKDSIQLQNGEWVKYVDITAKAKQLSQEYANAIPSRRKEIEQETQALKDNAGASLEAAKAKLTIMEADLKKAQQKFANNPPPLVDANGEYTYSATDGYAIDGYTAQTEVLTAYQQAIEKQKASIAELEKQNKGVVNVQQNLGKATETTAAATNNQADSAKKLAEEMKKALDVAKAHQDALKSLTEGINKQRIELEYGKLAAQYYADRLNNVTDAEARAAAGANQYSTYLAERKKLNQEIASSAGGLRDKYTQELSDLGLTEDYNKQIDAVKSTADKAVKSADDYKKAIDAIAEAAKNAGESVQDMYAKGTNVGQPASVGAAAAGNVSNAVYDFSAIVKQAVAQYANVPEALVRAVIKKETGWMGNADKQATAVSPAGALGVMQVMPRTGIGLGYKVSDLKDPSQNIMAGTKQLSQLMTQFRGDIAKVAAAYNAGASRVLQAGGVPKIAETQDYVKAVTQYYKEYSGDVSNVTQLATRATRQVAATLDKEAAGVNPQLIAVYQRANQLAQQSGEVGIKILDGVRTAAEQAAYVAKGTSKTLNGQHLVQSDGFSHAMDLTIPYTGKQSDKQDWVQVRKVNAYMQQAAKELNIPVEWGGDWKSFKDGFHFQLPKNAAAGGMPNPESVNQVKAAFAGINIEAAKYNGQLAQGRVTADMVAALIADKMTLNTNKLVKAAGDHKNEVTLTGVELRANQLTQEQYNDTQQYTIINAEQEANFEAERQKLLIDRANTTNNLATQYQQTLVKQNINQSQIATLVEDRLTNSTLELVKNAREHADSAGKTAYEYRQIQLDKMGLLPVMQASVLAEESNATFAEQYNQLLKERAAIQDQSIAGQYRRELSDKTLDKGKIERLTGMRMDNEFQRNMDDLNKRAEKATMATEAYHRMTLEREGFSQAQVNGQLGWEKEVTRMEEVRKLGDDLGDVFQNGITGAMQDMLHTGNSILDSLINKLVESVMTSQAMESVFSNFGNGITSYFGFAKGGAFTAGATQYYANGDQFHNTVLTKPTHFYANGGLAVAGEAGAEAVMPLRNGAVQALVPTQNGQQQVMDLPLARISGRLGVTLNADQVSQLTQTTQYASGGVFTQSSNETNYYANGDVFGANDSYMATTNAMSHSVITMRNSAAHVSVNPQIDIRVINNGAPVQVAEQRQTMGDDGRMRIDLILEAVDAYQAKGVRSGNSQTARAMSDTFNLQRASY